MEDLVVVGQKGDQAGAGLRVPDIATACRENLLRSPGLGTRDRDSISGTMLDELSEAAPNLALNIKNATAKPFELWVCATLGAAPQAVAVVFPGLATYHCKLDKAGTPVPAYGYPCFLIGALLVITGVALCGHVMEGVTTEHRFSAKTDGYGEVVKKMILARLILARPGSGAEIDQTYTPAAWELPTLQSNMDLEQILAVANAVVRGGRTFRLAEEAQLSENERLGAVFFPSQLRPPSSSLETKTPRRTEPLSLETASQPHRPAAMGVGLHDSVQVLMPQHDDTTTIGLRLAMTIEKVATKCAGIEAIQWRTGDNVSPSSVFISLPVAVQTLGSSTMDKAVRLLVRRQASDTDQLGEEMPNSRPWVLEERNELQSVLALWQYALAERQRAFQEIYAMKAQAFRLANHEHMYDELPKGTAYVRVVGYVRKLDTDVQGDSFWFGGPKASQQDWLGKRVFKEPSSFGILGVVHGMEREMSLPISHQSQLARLRRLCFGAFVS